MDLITPGLGLVFWSLITFFILLVVLKKFAWKPILGAVDERESGIKNALEAADKARKEMENLKADNERILNEARAEREAMLKDARDIKTKMVSDAKEEAQEQATKIIAQAQEAIEHEKRSAMAELKNHVASLSIEIAEKVVRQELGNKDRQLELVESMLSDAKLN
ncbi:F0F1 ATP synthase subunit B [Gelidibacter salicanalis]|uniref:ATP synthase subunit b n=1 Tax=Gelidibacter salicanalis TaxID=291193 RepID=A0A5C7AI96_9FLAO|nr:F0F1 ATP synthase subunit B [Gelidibacter salicanalis]MCK0123139.1 F0F1 ATP synthase subunit B [Gelidibacter sp. F2691]TXE08480.1 F0F1 ATP synthase subunit B [Gelidibacter salicanalis]